MPSFGYKISALYLTPYRDQMNRLAFDHVHFGDGGAKKVVRAALRKAKSPTGQADETTLHFLRIDDVKSSNWGHLVIASGGGYGDEAEVVDAATGQARPSIGAGDAIIRRARVLFVLPPAGEYGLLVSEVRSRSHLTPSVLKELNRELALKPGATARIEHDVADSVAWNEYLDQSDVQFSGVELVQHQRSVDDTRIGGADVRRTAINMKLVDSEAVRQRFRSAVDNFRGKDRTRPQLAELVGLQTYGDDAFDEERLIVVQDGKERRITVTSGWPSFTYTIDSDEQLSDRKFLAEIRAASEDTLRALGVDLPDSSGWWPNIY